MTQPPGQRWCRWWFRYRRTQASFGRYNRRCLARCKVSKDSNFYFAAAIIAGVEDTEVVGSRRKVEVECDAHRPRLLPLTIGDEHEVFVEETPSDFFEVLITTQPDSGVAAVCHVAAPSTFAVLLTIVGWVAVTRPTLIEEAVVAWIVV